MAHSALSIAREILTRAQAKGLPPLDPMKLIKMTYLAQGWMLGLYGRPIIFEDVEAWKYGPVYRSVYREVAGKSAVDKIVWFDGDKFDTQESHLLDQIVDIYGKMSGLQLSALTHTPGSPWDITYRTRGQNSVIPQDLMRSYYGELEAEGIKLTFDADGRATGVLCEGKTV
jgi:uncharacterized phage-associated protein